MEDYWCSPNPCKGGHIFTWVSNQTIDKVAPKGTECQCGAVHADGKGGIKEK
jgi:hypothetical protein